MRCAYLFAILAAVSVATSCKPRSDQSQALADGSASSTLLIERSTVTSVIDDSERGKSDMDDLAAVARTNKDFSFAERQFAAESVAQLVTTARFNQTLLKLAVSVEAEKGEVNEAPRQEVERIIAVYDQLITLLKPLTVPSWWSAWSRKKAEELGIRADGASAALGKIAATATTWKPKSSAAEPRPLPQLPPVVVKAEVVDQLQPVPSQQQAVPPQAMGAVDNGNNGAVEPKPAVKQTEKTVVFVPVKEPQPVKNLWLEAKRRVETIERDLLAGRFEGQVPTKSQIQSAVESARKSSSRYCSDGRPNRDSQCAGREIIDLLARISQLRELYGEDAGVDEGYTIRQHTERVLHYYFQQSQAYGVPQSSNDYSLLMPVVIAMHDIGKPVAVRSGNKDKQHEHNAYIVAAVLKKIGFTDEQAAVGAMLVGNDVLGHIVRSSIGPNEGAAMVKRYADAAKISLSEFFNLARPFYLADACSYPDVRRRYFVRENSSQKLFSGNGALERLGDVINGKPVVQQKPELQPVPPQNGTNEVIVAQPAQVAQGAVEVKASPWAGPHGKLKPQIQGALGPKSFIGAKYSTLSIGVSFYGDRVAHLYGEGQGENWYPAKWTWKEETRQILVELMEYKDSFLFDASDVKNLVWVGAGNNLVVPRVRPPN